MSLLTTTSYALKQLEEALKLAGLDIFQILSLQWYNDSLPLGSPSRIKPAPGGNPTLILIGNSKHIWELFLEACCTHTPFLEDEHPLEAYIKSVVTSSLQQCLEKQPYRIYWSHEQAHDLAGGTAYVAMQRMAAAAGIAYLDNVSHLSLHPTFGPWYALRACIVLDNLPFETNNNNSDMYTIPQQPIQVPNPLDEEAQQRVKLAVEHAMQKRIDGGGDKPSVDDVIQGWKYWLAVRDAVEPSHEYRYEEAQVLYHYTGDRELLAVEVEKRRKYGV